MRRTLLRAFAATTVIVAVSSVSAAKDYQCRQRSGCVAYKMVNGDLQSVSFRKGDLVSTQDGWVVDSSQGWKKIKSKGQGGLGQ